jgi:hypothetical protein
MLITFFNSKGIIHKEFVSEGMSVNSEYYLEVLKCLLASIKRMRPDLELSPWQLSHDNASAHTAINVRAFLPKNGVAVLSHHPIVF